MRLLLHWILSAIAVWIVAHVVPGISVSGPVSATILTLGLFWFVINAIMLELAAAFVRGFYVRNFVAAFIGAIALSIVSSVLQWLIMPNRKQG